MKTCRRCGVEKEITEFVRRAHRADGYEANCKECRRKTRQYNQLNKESPREIHPPEATV